MQIELNYPREYFEENKLKKRIDSQVDSEARTSFKGP